MTESAMTNSIGMRLVQINAGAFEMGRDRSPLPKGLGYSDSPDEYPPEGDYDEAPQHKVTLTSPFYMGRHEVTNLQYERFDPEHRKLRGCQGFSGGDDDAVIFVSWHEAVGFCEWLSKKENRSYRLPTEAEWEYACRAGTATLFNTGDLPIGAALKNNPVKMWLGPGWYPRGRATREEAVVPLTVGQGQPNAWGLHDMHGNVEEWCLDWYGPYPDTAQTDPVGRSDGEFRVTRGGSHTTSLYYLRSTNRMGAVPEDKHWMIGFRLVLGPMPATPPLPPAPPLPYQLRVIQAVPDAAAGTQAADAPYFRGPRTYVNIPPQSCGPLYSKHNHDPALAVCPNGDLLAIWYSGLEEPNRELCLLASRLRHGQDAWDPASPFWDAPDRNCHAPALWRDEQGTLYHFCGLSTGATWGSCALMMRRSRNNGVTWSKPRLIAPEHGLAPPHKSDHMPVACVFRMRNGAIVLPCDAGGNTVLHISRDNGETWEESEGTIRGIHAGVAELKDGRILAFGRTQIKDARMTMSVSEDMGRSWQYRASVFPDITWSQRAILIRLREGPLFLASFAGQSTVYDAQGKPATKDNGADMAVNDAAGRPRKIRGLFGALSFDEGETWPVCRVITGESAPKRYPLNRGNYFMMDAGTGEPEGYLTASQAPGGLIHLITSQRHYAFNAAWLKTPMPAIS